MKKSIRKKAPSPPSNPSVLRQVSEEKEDNASKEEQKPAPTRKYSSDESSEEEDVRELEGNVYTKSGMEVTSVSNLLNRHVRIILLCTFMLSSTAF